MERRMLLAIAFLVAGCGGDGGGSSSVSSGSDALPTGCVEVGSISNTGGPITIIATCTNGTGNSSQNCFTTGEAGSQPVPVSCDNGGSDQVIGSATPTP